jgi:monothiol glutaredoxin
MTLDAGTRAQIENLVRSNRVVLFMKGTREAPQCGFSATVVGILDGLLPQYQTVNVLAEPEIREGIKQFSDWPTIPQLYVDGEFVGGCDIVREMSASGELRQVLGLSAAAEVAAPHVTLTDSAARLIREAMASSPHKDVHVKIDARFQHSLGFGPRAGGEIQAVANGISLLFDADSALRAEGLVLDADEGGGGLAVDNPNQPRVRLMSPAELKTLLERGADLVLVDARTPEEHARARIAGARLADDALLAELQRLPRDKKLVFHCHHGGRSQALAERFAALGFRDVNNLSGGIDLWSQQIDPSVPRY